MAKFSETTIANWTKPPSDTESAKLENSEKMVREAILADAMLNNKSIEVFGQGSYANDTNVRLNSDIDINVCFTDGFYFDLPEGKTREDFGLNNSIDYSFEEFKDHVERALINKFGQTDVKRKNKCINIKGNSYRVETDVVPTWNFRRYDNDGSYVEGCKLKADDGAWVRNFPKQHINNGKAKNSNTSKRFKRLTRICRNLRYKMMDDDISVNSNISSFLIECLIWNVPNDVLNDNETWTDRLKQAIVHLYNKTKTAESCKEWGEVSDLLYLFYSGRKWSVPDVNAYLVQLWNYLGFRE